MTKRYRVVGLTAYREHAPGEEFIASLSEREEARALARGNVEILGPEPTLAQRRESSSIGSGIPNPSGALGASESSAEAQYAPFSRPYAEVE